MKEFFCSSCRLFGCCILSRPPLAFSGGGGTVATFEICEGSAPPKQMCEKWPELAVFVRAASSAPNDP